MPLASAPDCNGEGLSGCLPLSEMSESSCVARLATIREWTICRIRMHFWQGTLSVNPEMTYDHVGFDRSADQTI
jgi:hypothetical protein